MIDVVIVSDSKTPELIKLTEQSIDTCLKDKFVDKIIIVEQNEDISYSGEDVFTVYCDAPFNYNNRLNFGAEFTTAPYICFANNDLIFHSDWALELLRGIHNHNADSAAPYCPKAHKEVFRDTVGWKVRVNFPGWCFVWSRELYDKVGGLSEEYSYWCSDNVAAEQAKKVGAKNVLIHNSRVTHLSNQTGATIDKDQLKDMTWQQAKNFEQDYRVKIFPEVFYKRNLK
jgi:hypothetical protein